ncbi:hypothetical protein STEG23_002675 [Scotinomys teguina]
MTWKLYDLSKPGCMAVTVHHNVNVEVSIDFSGDYTDKETEEHLQYKSANDYKRTRDFPSEWNIGNPSYEQESFQIPPTRTVEDSLN